MTDRPDKPLHAPGAVRRARRLRQDMTWGERTLWSALRRLKLNVRRQAPIGRYVADFAQHEARLVIEVDGPVHRLEGAELRDAERDAWLADQGYRVVRVSAEDAFGAADEIAAQLEIEIRAALRRLAP